jgi:hypothetical protein
MKKIKYLSILLLSIVFVFPAFSGETVAVVLKSKGTVSVMRGNNAAALKLKRGFRLEDGDKIVTSKSSYAAVRFIDDASTVRIRPNSTCVIKTTKEQNQVIKNVALEVGTIFARVTKQRGRFEVSTPTSVASVKGTEFIADQRLDGGTFYFGEEGLVEVSNDAGTALLHAGETAIVTSKNSAPTVRKTRAGEKPAYDEEDGEEDLFEFEFENEMGQKKLLKFKAKKKE